MTLCGTTTELERDLDGRYDDGRYDDGRYEEFDVESILARVERRPLSFSRNRCMYQGNYSINVFLLT